MFSNLDATKKGVILVLVPVAFELCFVAALALLLLSAEKDFIELRHSNEAILAVRRYEAMGSRIYLDILTGFDTDSPGQLEKLEQGLLFFSRANTVMGASTSAFPELKQLTKVSKANDDSSVAILRQLRQAALQARAQGSDGVMRLELTKSKTKFLRLMMSTVPLTKQILGIEDRVHSLEPHMAAAFRTTLVALIAGGLLLTFTVTITLAASISRDIYVRLKIIKDNARLLASRQPLLETVVGRDEIAQLDRALHRATGLLAYAGEKERVVLDNAAAVICTLDQRLKFVATNQTASRFWQYEADQLLGLSLLTLVKPTAVDRTREQFDAIAREGGQGTLENDIRCADNTFITCQWNVNWLPEQAQYYCVVHDITAIRSAENFKQQVLSIVSHDLRAPLTAAGINLSLLLEGKRGELSVAARDELNRAQQSLTGLMRLANNLLQLEKLGSGSYTLDATCISIATVLDEAKQALKAQATLKGVSFKGPVGDAAVLADERRLADAAINLLSNALLRSPSGSVITIAISPVRKKGKRMIKLAVTDTGAPIAEQDRTVAYTKFYQSSNRPINSASHTATDGITRGAIQAGLNLAVVKAVVEAHGGECGVQSENGESFWIALPEFIDETEEDT